MASNFFKKINNLKSYTKISDLEIDQEYKIIDADKEETKFGKSIKIILKDGEKLYLPKRFSIIKKNELKYFKNTILIYKGKNNLNMDILEFKEMKKEKKEIKREIKKEEEENYNADTSEDEKEQKIIISDSDNDSNSDL